VFLSQSQAELEREMADLLEAVCSAVHGESSAAREVGARLVELGCTGDEALPCTMDLLGKGLLALPEFHPVERFAEPIVLVLGALASGFAEANRRNTFDQQENMKLSLLKAVRDAQWNLRASEARFEEVATSSASGILITELDGRLSRVNGAIADILGYTPAELTELTLFDLVHPQYAPTLREDYQNLLAGRKERIKQPHSLLRKDGEVARITLTASLLPSDDDKPSHFVTVIEDGTELMLLQVARLADAGCTNRTIASRVFVSPRTVNTHLRQTAIRTSTPLDRARHRRRYVPTRTITRSAADHMAKVSQPHSRPTSRRGIVLLQQE
jgi:PAS domain S-box-containing protein